MLDFLWPGASKSGGRETHEAGTLAEDQAQARTPAATPSGAGGEVTNPGSQPLQAIGTGEIRKVLQIARVADRASSAPIPVDCFSCPRVKDVAGAPRPFRLQHPGQLLEPRSERVSGSGSGCSSSSWVSLKVARAIGRRPPR